eukprot:TRINITY_DN43595_c0_g1_i1.p1 TRINITY_DN43595_c0_g1~~TRINITY_DN43595_c0_g1_i1.p1  ORF type:complete len:825 (-),score=139.30 TRINITY_DN43595_c0_g1_i1:195-2669(-)
MVDVVAGAVKGTEGSAANAVTTAAPTASAEAAAAPAAPPMSPTPAPEPAASAGAARKTTEQPKEAPLPINVPFHVRADSCVMQGRRPKQEDRHVKVPDLTKAAKALKMPIDHLEQPCAFFAVYDGHQGHLCAEYVAKNFHVRLLRRLTAEKSADAWTDDKTCSALREICEELDAEFLAKFRTALDGCTVVVTLIVGMRCFVAWVGDSRCVLGRRTSKGHVTAVALTEDHRPTDKAESERVKKAGGIIVDLGYTARVAHDGYEERIREIRRAQAQGLGTIGKEPVALAVSRALGDRDFKAVTGKALLVPTPSVRCIRFERSHKLLALMCDGISDVMKNEEVIEELAIKREPDPMVDVRAGCGALVQEAYKRGSQDNLTVILVRLDWTGASDSDNIVKRTAPEALESDTSVAGVSKRRRLEAVKLVSAQKVAAYERVAGNSTLQEADTAASSIFQKFDESDAAQAPSSDAAAVPTAKLERVASNGAAEVRAGATDGSRPSLAVSAASGREKVVLHGLGKPELDGVRGVALHTISDGRRVVRLVDGRELAFKPANIKPAEATPAASGNEHVVIHGLGKPELEGARGVALHTISDGRRVVRLADGRELAFKPANIRPVEAAPQASESEHVVLHGLGKPELDGARGIALHTISDGRRVVRLTDGRELAFKVENICPAEEGKPQAARGTGAEVSNNKPSALEGKGSVEVEIVGHPKPELNGTRGVLRHTISDGRQVVSLPDGRELAFKPENLRCAGPGVASAVSAKEATEPTSIKALASTQTPALAPAEALAKTPVPVAVPAPTPSAPAPAVPAKKATEGPKPAAKFTFV